MTDTLYLPFEKTPDLLSTVNPKLGGEVVYYCNAGGYGSSVCAVNIANKDTIYYNFGNFRKNRKKIFPTNFYPLDSTLLLISFFGENHFYILNREGNFVDSLPLLDINALMKDKPFGYLLNLLKIDDADNLFLIKYSLLEHNDYGTDSKLREEFFSENTDFLVEMTDTSMNIIRKVGKYPEKYKRCVNYYCTPHRTVNKNKIVYSFPDLDSLIIFDLKRDKYTYIPVKSRYKKQIEPFDYSHYMDVNYLIKYSSLTSMYYEIFYDKKNKHYYLIFKKSSEPIDKVGLLNVPSEDPWTLIVLNNDFKCISEVEMPKKYRKHYFAVLDDGLLVEDGEATKADTLDRKVFVKLSLKSQNNEKKHNMLATVSNIVNSVRLWLSKE